MSKHFILVPLDPFGGPFGGPFSGPFAKKSNTKQKADQQPISILSRWFSLRPLFFSVSETAAQVADSMMAPNGIPVFLGEEYFKEADKEIELSLSSQKKIYSALNPAVEVKSGHAIATVLARAEKSDVDSLLISTHGRKGLSRVLLGSVTEEVVRHSHKPTVVLGPHFKSPLAMPSAKKPWKIAVATDLTSTSLHWEKSFLNWFVGKSVVAGAKLEITLVHSFYSALHPLEKTAVSMAKTRKNKTTLGRDARYRELAEKVQSEAESALEKRQELWESWVESLAGGLRSKVSGISSYLSHEWVSSSEALGNAEKKLKPDFWIASTHSRGMIAEAFLGSTLRQLILQSSRPVIVFPTKRIHHK